MTVDSRAIERIKSCFVSWNSVKLLFIFIVLSRENEEPTMDRTHRFKKIMFCVCNEGFFGFYNQKRAYFGDKSLRFTYWTVITYHLVRFMMSNRLLQLLELKFPKTWQNSNFLHPPPFSAVCLLVFNIQLLTTLLSLELIIPIHFIY